jgi:diamine N-acetyltransferase
MDDAPLIYMWENQPEIWRTSLLPGPYSMESIRQYVQNATRHNILAMQQVRFLIETIEKKQPVGMIDLFDIDVLNQKAAVGIMIDAGFRKKGYAAEALRLIISYGFTHLYLHQLYADIAISNEASLRLFRSAGFEVSGRRKDWIKTTSGFEDALFMQIFNADGVKH